MIFPYISVAISDNILFLLTIIFFIIFIKTKKYLFIFLQLLMYFVLTLILSIYIPMIDDYKYFIFIVFLKSVIMLYSILAIYNGINKRR